MTVFSKTTFLGVEVGCTHKPPIKIVLTSSLSGEFSLLKVVYFSFGLPLSTSDVSNPIFEIKATEDNTNISTHMLSK